MAKRARLMTAEDVLEELNFEDDHESFGDLDDFDEPMMPGSDEEFGDCDLEDEEDENDSDNEGSYFSQTQQPSPQQHASVQALPTDWSSNLKPLTISDFTSTVGPTQSTLRPAFYRQTGSCIHRGVLRNTT